jgi:hypothetical protein
VIGAIINLHCGLHAEQYCTDEAKQSKLITLALLADYVLYFIEPPMKVCWEFVEVIIAWCKLTTAALYKLDVNAMDHEHLMMRAYCLYLHTAGGL